MSFEDPRRFLARHALRPKDSFGQCFLVAEPVADSIVAALDPQRDETVIDIGTGCGTLATMIAPRVREVVAIERDRDLVTALEADGHAPNITVVAGDAAVFDYGALKATGPVSIVGNLPYQITGKLLRAILAPPIRWRVAVVMVQREVAARMRAQPGERDWGVLGVFVAAACTVRHVVDASPRCFHPAPRVSSTVLALTPRATPLAKEDSMFRAVVHALFQHRRKMALNGLASVADVGRTRAAEVFARVGIDSQRRPETFTVEEFAALARDIEGHPPRAP